MLDQFFALPKNVRDLVHRKNSKKPQQHRSVLALETLEDRITPANFVVNTLSDEGYNGGTTIQEALDGTGLSFREAIELANTNNTGRGDIDGDTISFVAGLGFVNGGVLELGSELPTITDDVEIDGAVSGAVGRIILDADILNDNDRDNDIRIITINHARTDSQEGPFNGLEIVQIRNMNFQEGYARLVGSPNGGAMQILSAGDVFFEDVFFIDNDARGNGGAIYKFNAANLGEVWISKATLQGNRAGFSTNAANDLDGGGGAIFMDGGLLRLLETPLPTSPPGTPSGTTQLTGNSAEFGGAIQSFNGTVEIDAGVTFAGNGTPAPGTIVTEFGGAIAMMGGATYDPPGVPGNAFNAPPISRTFLRNPYAENLLITGANTNEVFFDGNRAQFAGAIYIGNDGAGASAIANITEADFENNSTFGIVPSQGGGAIFIDRSGPVAVNFADFENNQAGTASIGEARGGAIFARGSGFVGINGNGANFFRDNFAHSGGAVHFEAGTANASMGVSGYLLELNDATVDGGAFHTSGALVGTLTVTGANVRVNTAGDPNIQGHDGRGGGYYNSGSVRLNVNGGNIGDVPGPLGERGNIAFGDQANQGGGGIYNDGANASVSIGGVIIRDNLAVQGVASGGGIFNNGGTVNVGAATITSNEAARHGGGIYNLGGTLNVSAGSIISLNTAGQDGGGIYNDGTLNITGGSIGGGNVSVNGGGVFNASGSRATVAGANIISNDAMETGGGFYNDVGATVSFNGNTISGNDALGTVDGQGGGGIYNAGIAFGENNTVSSNTANGGVTGGGGGLLNAQGALATFIFNTFQSNQAVFGGGFRSIDTPSVATFVENFFTGNFASNRGGGGDLTGGVVSMNRDTIRDNSAFNSGGGVANTNASLIAKNMLVMRNFAMNDTGGAFYNDLGVTQISNLTITLNEANGTGATDGGGGIFNNGEMFITDSSIHANFALNGIANGGGVLNTADGDLRLIRGSISANRAARNGGGIENLNGAFTIDDAEIISNFAALDGGGMHLVGTDAVLTTQGGTFRDNTAGRSGGGVWNEGTLNLNDFALTRNVAQGAAANEGGGAIFNSSGVVNINGGIIDDNSATGDAGQGGAIFNSPGGIVNNTDGTLQGNTAAGSAGNGGGIYSQGEVNLSNISMNNNTANGDASFQGGGGLYNDGGTATIIGGTIDNNSAAGHFGSGGAIFSNGGNLQVTGATINNNNAHLAGGGVKVEDGTATLNGVTLDNNTAAPGPLEAGDIIIIGYRADDIPADLPNNGNDQALAWVPLVNLSPGQQIFFTDSGVLANGNFRGGEGAIRYTAGPTGLDAGTVMLIEFDPGAGTPGGYTFTPSGGPGTYTGANDATVGTVGLDLDEDGDNLFIFSGSTAAPNFIFGLKNEGTTFDADSTSEDTTALPANLTEGRSAVALGTVIPGVNFDDARYSGPTVSTFEILLANITTPGNWERIEDLPFPADNTNDITNGSLGNGYNIVDLSPDGGGGLHVAANATVTVEGGEVTNNDSAREGGGLWNNGISSLTLTDVTVSGNTAGVDGGGLYQHNANSPLGQMTITTSVVHTNDALRGAGLFVEGGTVTSRTSTFSGNQATDSGGGIEIADGLLVLLSTTVAANTSVNIGGGINQTGGNIASTSTLIGDNISPVSADLNGTINGDLNLLENVAGATVIGNNNIVGRDPVLEPLADNGGPTLTHRLKRGSPALDTGVDASALGTDQRGSTRPFSSGGFAPPGGDLSDIGAFESQLPPLFLVGLESGNRLVNFNDIGPANAIGVNIIGLNPGELIIALDSRIADHKLYGVSNQSNIYELDPTTGQATFISSLTVGLNDGLAVGLDQARGFFIPNSGFSENSFGQSDKWIKGEDIGGITGNPWYIVTTNGDVYKWTGGGTFGTLIASLGSNVYHNINLLVDAFNGFATLPAGQQTTAQTLDQTRRFFRSSDGDFYRNSSGRDEKWIKGVDPDDLANPSDVVWYTIETDGTVRKGSDFNTVVGTFDPVIWSHPDTLYEAFDDIATLPTAPINQQVRAQQLDEQLDFFLDPRLNLFEDVFGLNEKFFFGDAGAGGNNFDSYYVLPNGDLFRFNPNGPDQFIEDFDPQLWDNLDLLVRADDPFAALTSPKQNQLAQIDFQLGLAAHTNTTNPFAIGSFNREDKWLFGKNNQFGNQWYYITPAGLLVAWDGTGTVVVDVNDPDVIADVGTDAYQNPEVLYEAYDRQAILGTTILGAGVEAGADFNPLPSQVGFLNVNDSLRLVIDDNINGTSANYEIDIATGLTDLDSGLPANVFVPDIAYTNSEPNPAGTMLFTIDFVNDRLMTMNPNTGALTPVGLLNAGFDFIDGGLEIVKVDGINRGLAVLQVNNGGLIESRLYQIDLATGQALALGINDGQIGGVFDFFFDINDVALAPRSMDEIFGPV